MWSRVVVFLETAGALLGALVMPAESRGQGRLERRIPKSGEALPAVGLGTWQVFDVAGDARELAQAKETLRVFAEGGGRMVDSSPMYGSSEQVTGQLAADLGVRAQALRGHQGLDERASRRASARWRTPCASCAWTAST